MACTQYVSAEWVHDPIMNSYSIKAIGDDGNAYWIGGLNSDVPPWPQFLEKGGQITGQAPPPESQPKE